MSTPLRTLSRLAVLMVCSLFLSLVFAACGGATSTGPGSAPAAAPTKAPAPTQAAANSTPTPAATALQTYPGDGFKVGYPGDWKVTPDSGKVTFTSPDGNSVFTVVAQDNQSGASTDTVMGTVIQSMQKDMTAIQDNNVDATVALAGENWNQKSFDGDVQGNRLTFRVLATNHQPAGGATKVYAILFGGPRSTYDQTEATYFLPMMNSFQFA
ncbi:MAG TPA: hypothetical protein VKR06_20020 [Ktedonosporobacter sp.]|nr:hypothetical protein [Ktedonosporobacter sp.]